MEDQGNEKISRGYLVSLLLLMLVLPAVSVWVDYVPYPGLAFMPLVGKWFVFWAVGVRLFAAGLRQVAKPLFTLQQIFHIQEPSGQVVVRELGFANICFGLIGMLALFIPPWRPAAAFAGGLYMGIAGVYHLVKKTESLNEVVAMVSDIYILLIMAAYLASVFLLSQ
jgi:hypothetical protein